MAKRPAAYRTEHLEDWIRTIILSSTAPVLRIGDFNYDTGEWVPAFMAAFPAEHRHRMLLQMLMGMINNRALKSRGTARDALRVEHQRFLALWNRLFDDPPTGPMVWIESRKDGRYGSGNGSAAPRPARARPRRRAVRSH